MLHQQQQQQPLLFFLSWPERSARLNVPCRTAAPLLFHFFCSFFLYSVDGTPFSALWPIVFLLLLNNKTPSKKRGSRLSGVCSVQIFSTLGSTGVPVPPKDKHFLLLLLLLEKGNSLSRSSGHPRTCVCHPQEPAAPLTPPPRQVPIIDALHCGRFRPRQINCNYPHVLPVRPSVLPFIRHTQKYSSFLLLWTVETSDVIFVVFKGGRVFSFSLSFASLSCLSLGGLHCTGLCLGCGLCLSTKR